MAADEIYVDACRALLDDENVDVGVIGCVPLTPALDTLPVSPAHAEDLTRATAIGPRLGGLWRDSTKPWVAVIDAGAQYDPLADLLESDGIVTFRTADRALRALAAFCRSGKSGSG